MFVFFITGFRIRPLLISSITFLILAAIVTLELLLIFRSLRKMKVIVYDDKLIKQSGNKKQTVLWDDVVKIKRRLKPRGTVDFVRIYQKSGSVIYLYGFTGMDEIDELIRKKVEGKVILQTKRQRLNWDSPIYSLMAAGAAATVVIIIGFAGHTALNVFVISLGIGVGSWLLILKPISKTNLSLRWFEIILGIGMISLGIYGFIDSFIKITPENPVLWTGMKGVSAKGKKNQIRC
jgi:hypothetical protein